MQAVASSTSTMTGTAPVAHTADAVGTAVSAGTITSWPGPTPSALSTSCRAVAPLDTVTACGIPAQAANDASNVAVSVPSSTLPECSTRRVAATKASSYATVRRLRSRKGT